MMLRDQLSRKSEAEVRIKQHEKQCNDEGQRLEDLLVHFTFKSELFLTHWTVLGRSSVGI